MVDTAEKIEIGFRVRKARAVDVRTFTKDLEKKGVTSLWAPFLQSVATAMAREVVEEAKKKEFERLPFATLATVQKELATQDLRRVVKSYEGAIIAEPVELENGIGYRVGLTSNRKGFSEGMLETFGKILEYGTSKTAERPHWRPVYWRFQKKMERLRKTYGEELNKKIEKIMKGATKGDDKKVVI